MFFSVGQMEQACTRIWVRAIKVDFHLRQNIARETFSFCLRSSGVESRINLFNFNNAAIARETFCTKWKSTLRSLRMEPSRNLFNFNNAAVARAVFCTKWKSTLMRNLFNVHKEMSICAIKFAQRKTALNGVKKSFV